MRGLLVLGCFALGVFLVTASPQDQDQPEVEAKDEGEQGEIVHIREIRSTADNKKKTKPPRRTPGLFTALSKLPTRQKRDTEQKRKKCPGCYTSLLHLKKDVKDLAQVSRQQRDADGHEKLKRKHKHLKEKSHMKRRKHKDHEDRHTHFQAEDAEIGHNNQKRRKHHKGEKDRDQRRSGVYSPVSKVPPTKENVNTDTNGRQRGHRRGKDRSHHRSGSFTAFELAVPDIKKMEIDNHDRQYMTE